MAERAGCAVAATVLRSPERHGRAQAAVDLAEPRSGGRTFPSLRGLRRGDVVAIVVLLVLPVLVYGVPALLGHSVVPGDDLTQNYPLRVLVGRQIRAGHLPVYDPYIWSGAPLLAGWNAGAAYPLTLLFVILPGTAAWALNLIITWVVAGLGMFGFLRALRLRSLASFLGAMAFAFAGGMPAQIGHYGLVAGMSWVPIELLAILRLTADTGPAGAREDAGKGRVSYRLGWVCVLAASFGMTVLAGEPRAIDDAALVVAVYGAWRIIRLRRRWRPAAFRVVGGLVLGACLGAVQLLPGLDAVATSQRAANSFALFDSGSLPARWLLLGLVPDLLGGSGSFSQPAFISSYNLAEVTSYVGVLPLVAALIMAGRLRLRPRPQEWAVWHIMAVVGIVFALGGNTPLGHLLVHVPLFGNQRLQSRSIMVADLALAVLLAYWADKPFGERSQEERAGRTGRVRRFDRETALGVLAPGAMICVVIIALIWGTSLLRWLGVTTDAAALASSLGPWLVPYALIGAAAIAFVIFGRRLSPRLWSRVLAAFVVTDIVVFSVLAVVAVAPSQGSGSGSPASSGGQVTSTATASQVSSSNAAPLRPISALGYGGRFAIYDPGLIDGNDLPLLGSPDQNAVSATPSVQGYSSIVDGRYAVATGSHAVRSEGQDVLSPGAVSDGVLGTLNTSILLTVRAYLVTPQAGGSVSPGPAGTGTRHIAAGHDSTWYFGAPLSVGRIEVPDSDARQDAASGMQLGLETPAGRVVWFRASAASAATLEITPHVPVSSVAVIGRAGARPSTLGPPSVVEPGGAAFVADGQLQDALVPPQWTFAREDGPFAVFVDHAASGALSLQPLPGGSTAGASVTGVSGPADDPVSATVSSPHGVRLVRAVDAIPGWSAAWHPQSGGTTTLAVHRDGLVQSVDVPAGQGVVTWAYNPPGLAAGLAVSLLALAVLVVLVLMVLLARRSRAESAAGSAGPPSVQEMAVPLPEPFGTVALPVAEELRDALDD